MGSRAFRKEVREAMQYDNATLLFPDGIASGINLDGGFFFQGGQADLYLQKSCFQKENENWNSSSPESLQRMISFTVIARPT